MLLSGGRSIAGVRNGNRLGPGERLRESARFRHVYEKGSAFHGRVLVLFVLKDENLVRLAGFVAGRRVGGAVQRNRARRLMRESYRRLKSRLPERGFQFVLVARALCARSTLTSVEQEVRELLGRGGVFHT